LKSLVEPKSFNELREHILIFYCWLSLAATVLELLENSAIFFCLSIFFESRNLYKK
jgi:hypothetical protein